MIAAMIGPAHHFKVARAVVGFVAVFMVNNNPKSEALRVGDKPVLVIFFPIYLDSPVTVHTVSPF